MRILELVHFNSAEGDNLQRGVGVTTGQREQRLDRTLFRDTGTQVQALATKQNIKQCPLVERISI